MIAQGGISIIYELNGLVPVLRGRCLYLKQVCDWEITLEQTTNKSVVLTASPGISVQPSPTNMANMAQISQTTDGQEVLYIVLAVHHALHAIIQPRNHAVAFTVVSSHVVNSSFRFIARSSTDDHDLLG